MVVNPTSAIQFGTTNYEVEIIGLYFPFSFPSGQNSLLSKIRKKGKKK